MNYIEIKVRIIEKNFHKTYKNKKNKKPNHN